MTYEETLCHIFGRGRFGMNPGLDRIASILRSLDNPHEHVNAVNVVGTNGKGSTATFFASILSAAGLRVGLFTSPHLVSFTERMRINGTEIGEDDVVRLASQVLAVAPGEATFFEIVTAMALVHFAAERVDVAIMEAGMGGRFDATGIAGGLLTILTPISLDHCEYLGADVAAIAADKCGIIRPGRPVITAPQPREVTDVIASRCRETASPLYRFGAEFTASWEDDSLAYHGIGMNLDRLRPGIGGRFQDVNAACALAAAEVFGASRGRVPESALRQGIEAAVWPGRMEFVSDRPRLLLDGAHNPAAVTALLESLSLIPRQRLILVIGVMQDKDVAGILRPLLYLAEEVVTVAPALERSMPATELAALCRSMGKAARPAGTVSEGLALAGELAREDDLILVTGSLFTVGEARSLILGGTFRPMRG
jgi:dihydrofolate synthase / folylpolyglutamate synthase